MTSYLSWYKPLLREQLMNLLREQGRNGREDKGQDPHQLLLQNGQTKVFRKDESRARGRKGRTCMAGQAAVGRVQGQWCRWKKDPSQERG